MEKGEKAQQGVCGREDGERRKGKFTASLILLPSGHVCYFVIFMVKEKKANSTYLFRPEVNMKGLGGTFPNNPADASVIFSISQNRVTFRLKHSLLGTKQALPF